ncbi:MAG: hypothetical protein HC827_11015 [Cyanobacteria bacterium RM1_2_2]|nr:hypothetical protein [Cyanobacteria bacterium RM1_2_2]
MVKRWLHPPDRARSPKQARGCRLAMIKVLAGMDTAPRLFLNQNPE